MVQQSLLCGIWCRHALPVGCFRCLRGRLPPADRRCGARAFEPACTWLRPGSGAKSRDSVRHSIPRSLPRPRNYSRKLLRGPLLRPGHFRSDPLHPPHHPLTGMIALGSRLNAERLLQALNTQEPELADGATAGAGRGPAGRHRDIQRKSILSRGQHVRGPVHTVAKALVLYSVRRCAGWENVGEAVGVRVPELVERNTIVAIPITILVLG